MQGFNPHRVPHTAITHRVLREALAQYMEALRALYTSPKGLHELRQDYTRTDRFPPRKTQSK